MITVSKLAEQLGSGKLDLLTYINQLEARFAQWEPNIQAFVLERHRFKRLRQEATNLLTRFPTPEQRPPLFGVPVGVKDIFHVAGFPTRAGTQISPDELTGAEASVVTALKDAGALILGKTVTTEFAYYGAGDTRNPHNVAHTPGGSSSGSAAAVAAGICPLALGTQTIGSVLRPAAFCGVVGYKPSYDHIPKDGVIPLAPSFDHIGLFTEDIAGISLVAPFVVENWQPKMTPAQLPVLGIPEGPYLSHATSRGLTHFRETCDLLAYEGYTLKTVDVMPDFDAIIDRHFLITAMEAAQVHAPWYEAHADKYHPKTAELIKRGKTISTDAWETAKEEAQQLQETLMTIMTAEGIDIWICPAAPGTAPLGLESTGNPIMNLPWTQSGLPAITIPSGFWGDLPLGLQLVGQWYEDEQLIAWAQGIETVLKRR